jgi:hypothetical protein
MPRVSGVSEQTLVRSFKLNSHKPQNDMLQTNTTRCINRYICDLQVSTKLQALDTHEDLFNQTGMIQALEQPI